MDETEERKDARKTALGGSSGGTKGTSQGKGKPYTDAEIAKIKSDAAAEAGRQRKAAETERDTLKQELQSVSSRLDELDRERNESRLAEARGDPNELRSYQREQSLTTRERAAEAKERDVVRREAQVKSDMEVIERDKGVVTIAYIAAKHGLETEELESLGISDEEVLERVAEKLAAAKPKGEGEEGEEPGEDEEPFTSDSGITVGGIPGTLTPESVEKMSMPTLEKAIEKTEEKTK